VKHALAALTAASVIALAACGDDDDAAAPQPVALRLTGAAGNTTMRAPESVKGPLVRIEFTNATREEADAQLVRFDDGHSAKQALRAAEGWGERGGTLPDWVRLAGGVGHIPPGQSASVTQELEPGSYIAVSVSTNTFTGFEVTGGGEAGLQAPAGRIAESEYQFETRGLEAGRSRVLIENTGDEPHFVVGARMLPGRKIEDVRSYFRTEKGEPPVDIERSWDTSLMSGGGAQVVELELEAGRYALLCFVPDREGGPPHAVKGMISEAGVG
jgi:hypothetical protein